MDDSGCATARGRAAVRRAVGESGQEDEAVRAGGGELDGGVGEVAVFCACGGRASEDGAAKYRLNDAEEDQIS